VRSRTPRDITGSKLLSGSGNRAVEGRATGPHCLGEFKYWATIQWTGKSRPFSMARKKLPIPASKPNADPQGGEDFAALKGLLHPDTWALEMGLKVDGRNFSLKGREYVSQVMRDNSRHMVIPKAAQMSFTISFLVRTLHWMKERKWNHLYLLPLKTGAIPFVQRRIDPIIDSNSELSAHFASVDNRLHKQTKDAIALYIRGTNIDSELQEIPVDVQVWDERDRMVEKNLEEAKKRMSGSEIRILTELSTPTVPGHGVDAEDAWYASDQHKWEISCPGCSRYQVLEFDSHVILADTADESIIRCQFCHRPFEDHERASANSTGRWVPQNLNGSLRGYHINQFNSPTMPLVEILEGWYKGQKDARILRTFFNGALGKPYVAPGDQLTAEILDKCIVGGHKLGGIPNGSVFVGVDVGTVIHCKSSYLDRFGRRVAWKFQIFNEWGELDKYLESLTQFMCVIDAHPEKRAARDLALKYHGKVWLGFEMHRPNTAVIAHFETLQYGEAGKVIIDRTMAFDQVIKQYMEGDVILPSTAREIGELLPQMPYNGYYAQMMEQVRVEEEDTQGRIVAKWLKTRNPDHWHHADMFELIATYKKPSLEIPANVLQAFDRSGSVMSVG